MLSDSVGQSAMQHGALWHSVTACSVLQHDERFGAPPSRMLLAACDATACRARRWTGTGVSCSTVIQTREHLHGDTGRPPAARRHAEREMGANLTREQKCSIARLSSIQSRGVSPTVLAGAWPGPISLSTLLCFDAPLQLDMPGTLSPGAPPGLSTRGTRWLPSTWLRLPSGCPGAVK